MIIELHIAAEVIGERCGLAIHLSYAHDDYSGSRQVTFLCSETDPLLAEIKAIEVGLSCIKNRWKASPIVAYIPHAAFNMLLHPNLGAEHHKAAVAALSSVRDTFGHLEFRSPPAGLVAADATECAKSGVTKDTGTMMA